MLLVLAGTSVAAIGATGVKPNRVTLATKTTDNSVMGLLTVSGRAYRNGQPAANVTVTLRAGLMSNSLKPVESTRTGSDGRFLMEIEKGCLLEVAGRAVASSGGTTRVYLRATTSFAKSKVKRIFVILVVEKM